MDSDTETIDTTGISEEDLLALDPQQQEQEPEPEPEPEPVGQGEPPAQFNFTRSPRSRTGVDLEFALFFDLETIPDEERIDTFGLPELPEVLEPTPLESCPPPEDFLNWPISGMPDKLVELNPPDGWLVEARTAEEADKKPRKGAFKELEDFQKRRTADAAAEADRIKLLSTTPEFCRIVALGHAFGASEARAVIATESTDEKSLLEAFWEMAAKATQFVGFNILDFDIPVILFRSAILGVEPTCVIDRNRYSKSTIDLMRLRFGTQIPKHIGACKAQAGLYGIDVPAGETSGADVYGLHQEGRHAEIAAYVISDVEVERELFHRMSGYWMF